VAKASTLPPPENVQLKDPKHFKLIGQPIKRLDTPEKINGKGIFGIDVTLPGMLTAVIARPPVFGAILVTFNADQEKAIPGIRFVVPITYGIAVVPDGFWTAKHGRDLLDITWDEGPLASLDSGTLREQYAEIAPGRRTGTCLHQR
jgi:isoquinoline 1-oxidoreductase beta subunit